MGEVYRARDTRRGRDVAIKVLPADKLTEPARRTRFEQEARAVAALNHPNIVTIFEIESAEGVDFIVMELVAGKTLDALIPRQGMRLGEVLRIAIPLADALAAAHGGGIVHRDLKPANVMVTPEGVVKVLDFGLAKLTQAEEAGGEDAATLDAQARISRPGEVAGTPAYMSPEQATAGKVDARSDIFSFGALLYEMVTGRRPFGGGSTAEMLAALLKEQPQPPSQVAADVPKELERIILRCLRKEPERRFQHMLDVKVELQEVREESDSAAAAAAAAPACKRRAAWGVAGLAVLLIASAAAAWLWRSRATPLPPARVVPLTALPGYEDAAEFSPDGQQVAFSWNGEKGDNFDIYVKLIGASELHRLTTDPAVDVSAAWSPDGRQIAFVRRSPPGINAIHLISPLGGADRKRSDLSVGSGATLSWSPDGQWIAAARVGSPAETAPDARSIYLVPVKGGEPRRLTRAQQAGLDRAPALSPDGRRLAYAACVTRLQPWPCDVHVIELGSDLVPTGSPRRLTRQGFTVGCIAWAPDGRSLVYDTELGPGVFYLWRVDADGRRPPERVEVAGMGGRSPAIWGNRLAFTRWLYDQDIARLIPGRVSEAFPASSSFWDGNSQFSPDGRRLAFESMRSGERMEIWLAAADGQNPVQLTRGPGRWQGSPAWSPDGRQIAFDSQGEDGHWDIWTVDVEGGAPRRLTQDPGDENMPSWSRDGRWVYFTATRAGKGGIWRIPDAGGTEEHIAGLDISFGHESLDGKTLFFTTGGWAPLFAHPLAGGPEKRLLDCVWGGFAVVEGGVYYAVCGQGPDAPLHRLDLATGRDSVVGVLEKYRGSLAVSPDGKIMLYTTVTRSGSDLMLVEGFR
jgi:Tol biopolymer transport system component